MKTFEELVTLSKSPDKPPLLTGIERNTIDGLRGILLQCKYGAMDKQAAKLAYQEKKRNYENAQTEQELHQRTCRIRVEMAKVNQEMQVHGCELCKRALAILEGRFLHEG